MRRAATSASVIVAVVIVSAAVACDAPPALLGAAADPVTIKQRVDQIIASAEIIFAHDHLRDKAHLQSALDGHVTAMTVELLVDNMLWVGTQDPDANHCFCHPEVTSCCGAFQGDACYKNVKTEHMRFVNARDQLTHTMANDLANRAKIIRSVQDIDSAKASNTLGVILGTEGALAVNGDLTLPTCTVGAGPGGTDAVLNPGRDLNESDLVNVDALYQLGWRKTQLRHLHDNALTTNNSGLTLLGAKLVAALNRKGIVVDLDHLSSAEIDSVLGLNLNVCTSQADCTQGRQCVDGHCRLDVNNAPLLYSHEWQRGMQLVSDEYLQKLVSAGGGHGVVALNALGTHYTTAFQTNPNYVPAGPPPPFGTGCPRGYSLRSDAGPDGDHATLANFLDRLNCMIHLVGIDHVAIGPDFMPSSDWYAIGGGVHGQIPDLATNQGPNPGTVTDLVTALVTDPANYSDDDIKKLLGGNLRDLYQRVWDPTHGYDGGLAHFQLCGDTSTDPGCLAAAANFGQGDLHHRAINCQYSSSLQPVGLQLHYSGTPGIAVWGFRDLNGNLVRCSDNSTLVVSWADTSAPANGRLAPFGTTACDATCQAAIRSGGAGTPFARAVSCGNASLFGLVGLRLAYANAWNYYDIFGHLTACSPNSTWIASWGPSITGTAKVRLCDDGNAHPDCAAAATHQGSGTSKARALNCLNSTADPSNAAFGTVALQVAYTTDPLTGANRWFYWDAKGNAHRCLHGSVLVATTP